MRTTIDLPDDLLVEAKKTAADLRKPLRELVERGLRKILAEVALSSKTEAIDWVVVDGPLPFGEDVSDRESIYQWLTDDPLLNA